ncbi:Cacna1e, partial [Symbiodinium pilosum]
FTHLVKTDANVNVAAGDFSITKRSMPHEAAREGPRGQTAPVDSAEPTKVELDSAWNVENGCCLLFLLLLPSLRQMWSSITMEDEAGNSELRWLMFEATAAFLIAVNSIVLGLEVQYTSANQDSSLPYMTSSIIFGIWFIFEVLVRLYHAGLIQFFINESRWWNIVDFLLMGVSILDIVLLLLGDSSTSLSSLKVLKMIRVVRLFRVFRFFQQLTTLALMVAESVKQLMWALSMFVLIMYIFAITLTSNCTDWLKGQVDFAKPDWESDIASTTQLGVREVHHFFGSVPRSAYTLFQTTLGGISWHEVTDALLYVDALSFCLMFAYLVFTILALLNVFTGVFVDNAVQNSKKQRQIQIEEALEKKRMGLDQIIEFFVATDLDGDGTISLQEIHELLQDPVMNAYFDIIGFRPGDARTLADLLDRDGSGTITLNEFINGCERMKGQAKGIDVHLLLLECHQMQEKLDRLDAATRGVPYQPSSKQSFGLSDGTCASKKP